MLSNSRFCRRKRRNSERLPPPRTGGGWRSRLWTLRARGSFRVRPLDSLIPEKLPRTENAMYPFWSPDSRWIGFFADGKLKKVELSGGVPQAIADVRAGRGAAWSRDRVIVFANPPDPLLQVPDSGGEPKAVTKSTRCIGKPPTASPGFCPITDASCISSRAGRSVKGYTWGRLTQGKRRGWSHRQPMRRIAWVICCSCGSGPWWRNASMRASWSSRARQFR